MSQVYVSDGTDVMMEGSEREVVWVGGLKLLGISEFAKAGIVEGS